MGLGVLEDRQMAAPPGTSTLGASAAAGMLSLIVLGMTIAYGT